MSGLAILLALTAPGVDFGWQSSGSGVEFIIQIEPSLARAIASSGTREDIASAVPPELGPGTLPSGLQSVRIAMGEARLPRALNVDPRQRRLPPQGVKEVIGDPRSQGWQPAAGGGFEYIIELLAVQAQSLARGEIELIHQLPPEIAARGIRAFRVRMTNTTPPRLGTAVDSEQWNARIGDPAQREGSNAPLAPMGGSTLGSSQPFAADPRDNSTVPNRPPVSPRPITDPDYVGQGPPASDPVGNLFSFAGQATDGYGSSSIYGNANSTGQALTGNVAGNPAQDDRYLSQARELQESTRRIGDGLRNPNSRPADYSDQQRDPRAGYNTGEARDLYANPREDHRQPARPYEQANPATPTYDPLLDPTGGQAFPHAPASGRVAFDGRATNPYVAPPNAGGDSTLPYAANQTPVNYATPIGTTPLVSGAPLMLYPQQLAALVAAQLEAAQTAASATKEKDEPSRGAASLDSESPLQLASRRTSGFGMDPNAPQPWMPLVMTTLALFASLGANAYLAWVAWSFYERYRDLLLHVRER